MPMSSPAQTAGRQAQSCLVLMFKSPERSKHRIAREIGRPADELARHLFDCAAEDLRGWPGTICYAPAEEADASWLDGRGRVAGLELPQGPGNLGERINRVNRRLAAAGHERQIYIGIDCPEMTRTYLEAADDALNDNDVVLGPAIDGGVVLMGTRRTWPDLRSLPWSGPALGAELESACTAAGRSVATLAPLHDVDSISDLERIRKALSTDSRPARRALAGIIDDGGLRAEAPAR